MSRNKVTPIIGEPTTIEEAMSTLSDPDLLEDFTWAVMDWREAALWLSELNVPEENEAGNTMPMMDRIKWLIKRDYTT